MSLVDEIKKIPPVTRFICVSLVSVTVPMLLKVVSPHKLLFAKELVTHRFEVSVRCIVSEIHIVSASP